MTAKTTRPADPQPDDDERLLLVEDPDQPSPYTGDDVQQDTL